MSNYIHLARRADLVLGLLFAALAVYCGVAQDYVMAGVWALSSVVSFISAVVVPARWVAKRLLGLQLKH